MRIVIDLNKIQEILSHTDKGGGENVHGMRNGPVQQKNRTCC